MLFHYGKYFFCETTHKFDGTFFLWWILFSNCFGATEMNFDRRNPTFQPLHRYTTRCRSLPLEPPEMLMKFWDMKGGHVAFRWSLETAVFCFVWCKKHVCFSSMNTQLTMANDWPLNFLGLLILLMFSKKIYAVSKLFIYFHGPTNGTFFVSCLKCGKRLEMPGFLAVRPWICWKWWWF